MDLVLPLMYSFLTCSRGQIMTYLSLHHDFLQDLLYKPLNLSCTASVPESESTDYGACVFKLNGLNIRFRVAKITPTKIGQFVTLWKRIAKGPIQPYDALDAVDFFVISVRDKNNFGQFVFPKSILLEKDIFSKNGKGGKRGIRVYPAWDKALSSQAKKTQQWQLNYFLNMPTDGSIDYGRASLLYSS